MEKIDQRKLVVIVVLVTLGFGFYWYSWRPSRIKKECSKFAENVTDGFGGLRRVLVNEDVYKVWEGAYKRCISGKGL